MKIKQLKLLSLIFILVAVNVQSQDVFHFRGMLLNNKKILSDAEIIVFEKEVITLTKKTSKIGKFSLNLDLDKDFVIEFKKEGFISKKINVSTFLPRNLEKSKYSTHLVVQLNPITSDYDPNTKVETVASYRFNEKGNFFDVDLEYSDTTILAQSALARIEQKRQAALNRVAKSIENLSVEDKEIIRKYFQEITDQADQVLFLAQEEAEGIVQFARLKSQDIIAEADVLTIVIPDNFDDLDDKKVVPKKVEAEMLGINDDDFRSREDIIRKENELKALRKNNQSLTNSLEISKGTLYLEEELYELARIKIENKKLNLRTREDSIELYQAMLLMNEKKQEIEQVKTLIARQEAELKAQNTLLLSGLFVFLLLVVVFFILFRNYQAKKRSNNELAKKNEEIKRKNSHIMDSINYAQTIQQAILPMNEMMEEYFDYFILFQPKDVVSGDFYWFSHRKDINRSFLAIVDCTGHGVPGAFMSMIGNQILNEIVNEKNITEPKDILSKLNSGIKIALMQEKTENNDGMDVCLCSLEKNEETNETKVIFAGAKRPLFTYRKAEKELELHKGTVKSIGGRRLRARAEKEFEQKELIFQQGDLIYLTTDGYVDQGNMKRKKFGRAKLMKVIREMSQLNLYDQQTILKRKLDEHQQESDQRDDITIFGVQL